MINKRNIILASQSPRRKELLTQAGFEFEIITSDVDEVMRGETPGEVAEALSSQKAEDVYSKILRDKGTEYAANCLIIGADTVVAVGDEILGKPKDRADASRMMRLLSGKVHQVYTGVTIITGDDTQAKVIEGRENTTDAEDKSCERKNRHIFSVCTDVEFYEIWDDEIDEYLEQKDKCTGQLEWKDKAGGYGIQGTAGARFIKGFKGDYNNVVGLPVVRLYQEMKMIEVREHGMGL